MLQVQAPIGSLIFHTYHELDVLNDHSLSGKIENLVDIIQHRTIYRGIEYTSKSVYNELFDIRLHFINILAAHPKVLDDLSNKILDEIADKYLLGQEDYDGLGLLISDVLEVYYKIFSVLVNKEQELNSNPFPLEAMPAWSGFKILLAQYPNKAISHWIIKLLESSFDLDYALLISEFIFRNELKAESDVIQGLKRFLKNSIIDFGTYCVLTDYWKPDITDEHQIVRNIKIRAAVLRLEDGQGFSSSSDRLEQLLTN